MVHIRIHIHALTRDETERLCTQEHILHPAAEHRTEVLEQVLQGGRLLLSRKRVENHRKQLLTGDLLLLSRKQAGNHQEQLLTGDLLLLQQSTQEVEAQPEKARALPEHVQAQLPINRVKKE